MPYKTKVVVTITSDRPIAKPEKLEKAEAWVDAALTVGFKLLGTFSKYNVSDVEIDAEVSQES